MRLHAFDNIHCMQFNSVSLRYDLPVVLTVKDISKILQISIYEVDELINTGLIKTIPLLKENRIFTNHFMEFINSTNTLFENSDGEYVWN